MELSFARGETWAAHVFRGAVCKIKFISSCPVSETVTLNVVPGVLETLVCMFAEGVGDEESSVQVLVAAIKALG